MSFADIKERMRRAVHGRLAVAALLVDDDHPDGLVFADDYAGPRLTVRYHNKLVRSGDLDGDYAQIIDGIDKLVFNDENIAAVSAALVDNGQPPLLLARAALVTIPAYKGATFSLDTQEPTDGPAEVLWTVARIRA